jgi:L-amino acid N-acyltransferase YncA
MNFSIKNMNDGDWPEVSAIYREGISNDMATFETSMPDWRRWNTLHFKHSGLVGYFGQELVGWAALNPINSIHSFL